MKTIKIFLASSAELLADRDAFKGFLYERSKLWLKEKGIFLELVNWEDFIDAVSQTRLQDEYNKAINESDIFVMLFWTKVGKYTEEEFDTAYTHFKKEQTPFIYTYFKDVPTAEPKQPSLEQFREKLEGDLGHFKTVYRNIEGLLLHFSIQLDKILDKLPGLKEPDIIKKKELTEMVSKNKLVEAFEQMNYYFHDNNDSLNALINEFINPSYNFNQVQFITRLRVFINQNWP